MNDDWKMKKTMNHLDLFSGIGGFALAGQRCWGDDYNILAFCEKEEYARKVLRKNFPDVNIINNIKNHNWSEYVQKTDLITAGWPCQPFSQCGKQQGREDDRYLWPELFEVIKETRPTWFVGENVTGIIKMEIDNVLSDLEGEGYSFQSFIIPAVSIDALHRRDRVWIVAHSRHRIRRYNKHGESEGDNKGQPGKTKWRKDAGETSGSGETSQTVSNTCCKRGRGIRLFKANRCSEDDGGNSTKIQCREEDREVSDSNGLRWEEINNETRDFEEREENSKSESTDSTSGHSRQLESRLGGEINGFSTGLDRYRGITDEFNYREMWSNGTWEDGVQRVTTKIHNRAKRIKTLGNAIVPQVAYEIFLAIREVEKVDIIEE